VTSLFPARGATVATASEPFAPNPPATSISNSFGAQLEPVDGTSNLFAAPMKPVVPLDSLPVLFQVGQRVYGKYRGDGIWYPAYVTTVHVNQITPIRTCFSTFGLHAAR
jgi:hypothetical protein